MGARSRWITVATACALWLDAGVAGAAPINLDGVRIDQLQPASPESAFVRAEGPHAPFGEGVEFAVGATFEYAKGVLREVGVDSAGGTHDIGGAVVDHALLARISGSITPLHWLSFDLSLPFVLFEKGKAPDKYVQEPAPAGAAPGVGDLRIGVHFRPLDTKVFGVIIGGRFWAPFGSQDAYLSDHRFRAEVDLGFAGDSSRLLYGCTFNLAPGFFVRRDGDRLAAACALHVVLAPVVSLGVEPSFQLLTHNDNTLSEPGGRAALGVLVEPLGALRFTFGDVRLGLAAGPGFGGGMGSADIRGLLSVAYVGLGKASKLPPQPMADRDLDKIPDHADACPDEAGPARPERRLNGCPSHDRDGDSIRDEEDYCPDRSGIRHVDPKANGCPDTDNDSLPDPIDRCVEEPGAPPSGCPKFARLSSGGFRIEPPIDFGASEKLRAALEEVAATLRANPKLPRVTISIGTKGVRQPVTDKRAQDVLLILRAANLDTNRYEVILREDLRGGLLQVRNGR